MNLVTEFDKNIRMPSEDLRETETAGRLPHPECLLYEPLSLREGKCLYDKSIVNIDGCNNQLECDRHKIYVGEIK